MNSKNKTRLYACLLPVYFALGTIHALEIKGWELPDMVIIPGMAIFALYWTATAIGSWMGAFCKTILKRAFISILATLMALLSIGGLHFDQITMIALWLNLILIIILILGTALCLIRPDASTQPLEQN